MSNTVSTDLARRLAKAGLQWEPKVGDWVQWGDPLVPDCLIVVGTYGLTCQVWRLVEGRTRTVDVADCLWLPTLADCLDAMWAKGLFPAVAAYPESLAGPAHWGAWVNDLQDQSVGERQEGDNPAEATGLALAAVLEGEKA